MLAAELQRHPESLAAELSSVRAELKLVATELVVRFVLDGNVAQLRIPAPGASRRVDGLWQHTCFELFTAPPAATSYHEFNLSPSGEWAAYAFESYRRPAPSPPQFPAPLITVEQTPARLILDARVALTGLSAAPQLRLGVSAVVETKAGAISYWALRHRPGKPDFHHADAFALEMRMP